MWNKVDNNCGIGAGGFQPGNKCAKEDGAASPTKKEEGGGLFGAMIGKLSDKMNDTAKTKADKHRNALNDAPPPPPVKSKSAPSARGFEIARKYGLNPAIVNLAEVGHTYIQKHDWKAARQTYLKGLEEVDKESLKERLTRKVKAGLKLIKFQFSRILDWIKDKVKWIWDKVGQSVRNADSDNCGTGAGGFKKGNTCAKGSTASFSTVQALGKAISPPGSKPYRIGAMAGIPGVKQLGREVHGRLRNNPLRSTGFLDLVLDKGYIDSLLNKYKELGFRPLPGSYMLADRDTVLEHPEGHQIEVILSKQTDTASLYIGASFVPPEQREGYQVSREAFLHSVPNPNRVPTGIPFGLQELLLRAGSTDAAFLRKLHERFIKHHEAHASQTDHWPDQVIQHHRKAIGLHSIARDYYMDKLGVQNANCGTGDGGFKKGNTCRWGGHEEVATDRDGLAKAIGMDVKPTDVVSDNSASYHRVFRDGADPEGGWYAMHAATQFERRIEKNLTDLGFKLKKGSASTYEHPQGHMVSITVRMPADNRAELSTYIVFIPKQNREGYMLTTDSLEQSVKAADVYDKHIQAAHSAWLSARQGKLSEAANDHRRAAEAHETAAKGNVSKAVKKGHLDAAAIHRIAYDWYAERAGLQANSWKPIRTGQRGSHVGTGR